MNKKSNTKAGQPQGIADIMQPLFEKSKGVIERALEEQARENQTAFTTHQEKPHDA